MKQENNNNNLEFDQCGDHDCRSSTYSYSYDSVRENVCDKWKYNNPCQFCTTDIFCSEKDKVTGKIKNTFMRKKKQV